MMRLLACGLLLPFAAQAEGLDLSATERAAFRAELRAAILAEPEVVAKALERPNPVQSAFRQNVADDLLLIDSQRTAILGDADVALFVRRDCTECARAVQELTTLSKTTGATFILHDIGTAEGAKLAETLEIDTAPFYVLPKMMLRGHIPQVVLQKYLAPF